MTYALSLIICNIFMCVISSKDAYSQFVFDIIDPSKYMSVWIKFPVEVLISDGVSHWSL